MITHYVDCTVVPDPETSAPQLMGALYDRLHQALVKHRLDSVGVSFPQYSLNPRAIGNRLRLHGSSETLGRLMTDDWLKGMRDHVRMTEIQPAPQDAVHRTVQRKQFKTSADRLRRRRMKRKGETAEQAGAAIPYTAECRPDLPHVHLRSRSTGQPFHLFVGLGPLQAQPKAGAFNCYGLSGATTIPWF
jgi:CRISPR-associated endonuclease Csy4